MLGIVALSMTALLAAPTSQPASHSNTIQNQLSVEDAYFVESPWAVVGDPGNRGIYPEEQQEGTHSGIGAVNYTYRISKLEVNCRQYYEFIIAYAPFYFEDYPENFVATETFTGELMYLTQEASGIWTSRHWGVPTAMGWEYAARYVNWLHNGRINERWAFETGVFDTSTFAPLPDGTYAVEEFHSPNARFWLPTIDEWTKAAYWDPNKWDQYADQMGSYWLYPNMTDVSLIPLLLPRDGGQRNGGYLFPFPRDVGNFPNEKSPWGVLDMAGGVSEWTEYLQDNFTFHSRGHMGSSFYHLVYNEPPDPLFTDKDRLSQSAASLTYWATLAGMRVVTTEFHPADMDRNGLVNTLDLFEYAQLYMGGDGVADYNNDGELSPVDIQIFVGLMSIR